MSKKDRSILVPEKKDAFTRILRFMTKADITLAADEERILDRWIFVDVLLRLRTKLHEEIVEEVVKRWGVSKFTAINDINFTQRLFERSRQMSKKYLLHQHIEHIGQLIAGTKKPDPRLLDSYTKAIMAIPEEVVGEKQPPPVFIFNVAPGQTLDGVMDKDEALAAADAMIQDMEAGEDGIYRINE